MSAQDGRLSTTSPPEPHPIAKSIVLHLLPGTLVLVFYVIVAPLAHRMRAPSALAFLLGVLLIHIPFQLGYLLYQGKKRNGRLSLEGILHYRERIPWWQYLALGLPCLIWLAVVPLIAFRPINEALAENLFGWLPEWFPWNLETLAEEAGQYSPASIWLTVILMPVVSAIAGPLAEELYYRGYLLPRLSRLNKWAPLANAALFALDHMYEPWLIPGAFVGFLPMVYAVWWKKSLRLGIWVHCGLMTLSTLAVLASFLRPG